MNGRHALLRHRKHDQDAFTVRGPIPGNRFRFPIEEFGLPEREYRVVRRLDGHPDSRMGDNRNSFVGGSRRWGRKTNPRPGQAAEAGFRN